jgi:hypothetical protein
MLALKERLGATVNGNNVVLLARLVDRDGVAIGPADVAAIEWFVSKVDGRRLEVGDVLHNALQFDELWSVDEVGYNFRHEIALSDRSARGQSYVEVQYVITLTIGEQVNVRFQLKVI